MTWVQHTAEPAREVWRRWTEQLACSDPSCSGTRRLWRGMSHHGQASMRLHAARYCFPECFDLALQSGFAQLLHSAAAKQRRPHRIPLGLLLLARGDIDVNQLREALAAQHGHGEGRIGEWIERLGFANEAQITAAVGAQWACPVLPRVPARPIEASLPLLWLRRFRMVPVHYAKVLRTLHIAFSETVDYAALLAIEQALECHAQPCIISSSQLDFLLDRMEERPVRPDQTFAAVHTPREMTRLTSSYAAAFAAESVRVVRCAELIWARIKAKESAANLLFQADEQREEYMHSSTMNHSRAIGA